MSKNRSAAGITNIVQYDANKNITFVSGSATLLTVSSSGALTTTGTITAQTLVVQTITSSVNFVTGSTKFGVISSNTHQFTGSMSVSGSTAYFAGNVGVGTTSPNIGGYGANSRLLTIQGTAGSYGILELTSNSANADGNAIGRLDFGSDGQAANYKAISSIASFLTGSTSTKYGADLRFYTRGDNAASGDPSERMRITAAGNVGIGATNITGKLMVYQGTAGNVFQSIVSNQGGSTRVGINLNPSMNESDVASYQAQSAIYATDYNYSANIIFATKTEGAYGNALTERMRITSGGYFKASVDGSYLSSGAYHEIRSNAIGNLLVMQQTASSGTLYGIDVYYTNQSPNNTTSTFMTFYDNVNIKAIVYSNGTFGSRTSTYGGVSDIKLKENISPATPKLDDLMKVNVVNYNFINDDKKEKQLGVISQELEEIFPNMVFESEDKETGEKIKNVKYSIFVPMLIKAIQELKAEIDALKAQ